MTTIKCPRPPFRPRAGSGVTSLFLAGLAVSGAVGMLITPASLRPAAAQTVANPNDQPTPATVSATALRLTSLTTAEHLAEYTTDDLIEQAHERSPLSREL